MDIARQIRDLGGLAASHELLALGWTYRSLSRLAAWGRIIRVRQGWYAEPTTDPTLLASWRVGGRLTCVSGARALHLAAPVETALHVCVPPHDARLRRPVDYRHRLTSDDDVVVHWRTAHSGSRYLVSAKDCVLDSIGCQPPEYVLAMVDSALRSGLLTSRQVRELAGSTPAALRVLLAIADRRSESFPESVSRARLFLAGIPFQIQQVIAGYRVDFLIGHRLIVEVDGREFHSDAQRFEADRARDAALSIRGYRVLRFSYLQVVYRWNDVEGAIRAAMSRGDHL